MLIFIFLLVAPLSADESCRNDHHCTLPSARDENWLFSQVNAESQRLYNSLDCKGKVKALELAKSFQNKNLAVQEAAKEMGERQKLEYPNELDYTDQTEREAGQEPFNRRFGY